MKFRQKPMPKEKGRESIVIRGPLQQLKVALEASLKIWDET
jgi:hypothetical protein